MTQPSSNTAVERVAAIIDPVWMNPPTGSHVLENYPGQADKHREVARQKATAAIEALNQTANAELPSAADWLTGMSLGSKLRPSDFGMLEGAEILTVESAVEAMESYATAALNAGQTELREALERIAKHESRVGDHHMECGECRDAYLDDYAEVKGIARKALSEKGE